MAHLRFDECIVISQLLLSGATRADIASGQITNVFSPSESLLRYLSYLYEWNKGSGRLVALGGPRKAGKGSVSAIINVDNGIGSLEILTPSSDDLRVADGLSYDWHPDDRSMLVTGIADRRLVPVSLAIDQDKEAKVFRGIPNGVVVRDPVYTSDGLHIIAAFGSNSRE